MIGYLNGTVKFLFDDGCILDVHGGRFKSGGTIFATRRYQRSNVIAATETLEIFG